MLKGRAAFGIAALAVLAIVLGLVLTGGPGHARKERRDSTREQDLQALANWADCLATAQGKPASSLETTPMCQGGLRMADPADGTPYRYEVTGPRSYRLCATFELPPQRPNDSWGRNAAGCLNREYIAAATPGAAATIPYSP